MCKVECIDKYTRKVIKQIAIVTYSAWPSEKNEEERIQWFQSVYMTRPNACSFVIREQEDIVAHAGLFTRSIKTLSGELFIGCLAAVCVLPDYKGRGYGKAVVKACFELTESRPFDVIVFQTRIKSFYEKLGARQVFNPFVNSLENNKNSWWDDQVMIYPACGDWPDGTIDLMRPGY